LQVDSFHSIMLAYQNCKYINKWISCFWLPMNTPYFNLVSSMMTATMLSKPGQSSWWTIQKLFFLWLLFEKKIRFIRNQSSSYRDLFFWDLLKNPYTFWDKSYRLLLVMVRPRKTARVRVKVGTRGETEGALKSWYS
jgi:hypothetical protein